MNLPRVISILLIGLLNPVLFVEADESFETSTSFNRNGLRVTVDFYESTVHPNPPIIVLYHQAGWSRGEYREIAPRLNSLGFHALAVDQRSGGRVNGVENETAKAAREANLGTAFTDAIPDLQYALLIAQSKTSGPIIAWGSSYSSALALKVVAEESVSTPIAAVMAFSPAEYFPDRELIQKAVGNLQVPTFITSSRSEAANYADIVAAIPESTPTTIFRPTTAGTHGSSALWSSKADSEAYWTEVERFLAPFLRATDVPSSLTLSSSGQLSASVSAPHLLEGSTDLQTWSPMSVLNAAEAEATLTFDQDSPQFFRLVETASPALADVVSVSTRLSGERVTVSVGIRSAETGCDQYADWWEVLDEDGQLLYRRILAHSHVNEQPFVRSGSLTLAPDQVVWVRAHMNNTGYGGQAFKGSINSGFGEAELSPLFALDALEQDPLPNSCAF